MAWTTPGTAVAGGVLTAAFWNTQVRDNLSFVYGPPMVRVRRSTTQSLSNGVLGAVQFNTEDIDNDTMFSASSAIITIKTAGVYAFTGCVSFSSNGTGNRAALLYHNPTLSGSGDSQTVSSGTIITKSSASVGSTTDGNIQVATIYNCAVNDTIALAYYQNSGGALNSNSGTETSVMHLSASWIGKV